MPRLITEAWRRIGASDTVLKWISEGVPLQFDKEPDRCDLPNRVSGLKQHQFVDIEVRKLLAKGYIRRVNREDVHCVLPLRCVPKKQQKHRLVLDCRHVNQQIICPTFSQEGIQSVADQIEEGDQLISVDLESGFHHVPVKFEHQKYIGFRWNNCLYVWTVLAFGIKSAPYFFNKVLRPVVRFLRENGIRNALFVDDFLFMIKSMLVADQRDFIIHTLNDLGWCINYEKSCLQASTTCEFIGFNVHSTGKSGPWLQVTQKKLHKLRRHLQQAIKSEVVSARFLAKIGGECIAMMKAVLPAKLLLRNLYKTLSSKMSWDSNVVIDVYCRKDLEWWYNALKNWNGAPLLKPTRKIQVETDASGSGWGGCTGSFEASGTWTKDVSFRPSNYRELLAVLKSIQSFRNVLHHASVQILSDNITTVAYINQLGGTSRIMSELMTTIFVTAQELGIFLTAKYLAGKDNGRADGLSRIMSPYEWQLHPEVFQVLESMWGPHTVDRFASEMTTQLPRYNSLFSDPGTEAVDAMMQKWSGENNYINAPFWMLTKIVRKVKEEKVTATIIAPKWPAQVWYQDLQKMSLGVPFKLPNTPRVMLKRSGVPEPLKNRKWCMYAWRICGDKG